jgi:hypothetical protein
MDLSHVLLTLLAASVPLLAILAGTTWLAGCGVGRFRLATREGRVLVELVIEEASRPGTGSEKPAPDAFRP